jgi:hypothetical protein
LTEERECLKTPTDATDQAFIKRLVPLDDESHYAFSLGLLLQSIHLLALHSAWSVGFLFCLCLVLNDCEQLAHACLGHSPVSTNPRHINLMLFMTKKICE